VTSGRSEQAGTGTELDEREYALRKNIDGKNRRGEALEKWKICKII
jgi:hypothetical protein